MATVLLLEEVTVTVIVTDVDAFTLAGAVYMADVEVAPASVPGPEVIVQATVSPLLVFVIAAVNVSVW
ncbi:MAG: hypothetical protein ACRD4M_02885, partial [Candidatus Acidiferrales bacterium]